MKTTERIAVVTGANRGLGFEVSRQLAQKGCHVILTARDEAKGKAAAEKLVKEGRVSFYPLDVTRTESIERLSAYLEELGRVDVLVNNAGIFLDESDNPEPAIDRIRKTMETNVYGPYQLCERILPLMKKHGYGRVVNVSSGMGQLSEMNGGYPGYRISKTALNAVTRIFSDDYQGTGILVNSVCPGWVKTDLGGPDAERSIPEGADTIVWLATLPENGPTGGFFRDREPIAW